MLLLIGMPIGWLGGNTSTGDAIGFVVATAISLALMALIFLRLLPRERAAGQGARTSLILALVAVLLTVVFWTGLSFAVAAGAVALGLSTRATAARNRRKGIPSHGTGRETTAAIVGGFVLLAGFIALLTG